MKKIFVFYFLLLFVLHSAFAQPDKDFRLHNKQHKVVIPFELWNNHIYIKVRVNNSDSLCFLFDNGAAASGIMVDSSMASKIGLKETGKITAAMTGGNSDFLITDSVSLTIGKLFIFKQKAAWFHLKEQEKDEGHKIDGILGYSFFKYFVFEVDYLNKRLTIADPHYYNDKKWANKIPLVDLDKNRVPIVTGTLISKKGKKIKSNFTMDTGHDEYIVLGKQFVIDNKLENDTLRIQPKRDNAGLGGETIHKSGVIKGFSIGAVKVQKSNAIFSFDNEGVYSNFNGVLLGGQFFKTHKLILNYPKKYLVLTK